MNNYENIKSVSSNFESISKQSVVVEKLLEKKKHMYENACEKMNDELEKIQENINDKLKNCIINIKFDINKLRDDIEIIKKNFLTDYSRYTNEGCRKINKQFNNLMLIEKNKINKFRQDIKDIEFKRWTYVIEIIKKYNNIIKNIAYMVHNKIMIPTNDEIQVPL
ncbi:hypothetical protein HCN44_005527 [Aphidius gifuensis]|uniref:DUF4455 domain-containing protein n=1 Tax=Aphidius gifuensis TaxID=684658 RepID=A0A835CY34_APHGI|nr:hypothetical protein HCN44_005527 [Aphidius gifuensis]